MERHILTQKEIIFEQDIQEMSHRLLHTMNELKD